MPSRPIHLSVDRHGEYLLTAYNNPSHVGVHRLNADGSIGALVGAGKTRRRDLCASGPGDAVKPRSDIHSAGNEAQPSSRKIQEQSKHYSRSTTVYCATSPRLRPAREQGFGPRHLDFHPSKPWVFVSIERQNKLYVYEIDADSGLKHEPLFVRDTLSRTPAMRQAAGAIHIHPNGKFVYVTNRASDLSSFDGKPAVIGGQNDIAVFSVDEKTGEPTLIQNADGHSIELRTFGIDPSGRMLVAASVGPVPVLEGTASFRFRLR